MCSVCRIDQPDRYDHVCSAHEKNPCFSSVTAGRIAIPESLRILTFADRTRGEYGMPLLDGRRARINHSGAGRRHLRELAGVVDQHLACASKAFAVNWH